MVMVTLVMGVAMVVALPLLLLMMMAMLTTMMIMLVPGFLRCPKYKNKLLFSRF